MSTLLVQKTKSLFAQSLLLLVILFGFLLTAQAAEAATLALSPATGVYSSGGTFTARVVVNTGGKSVNAAEGTLKFNPQELQVVSANRSGSIFNLWVAEPSFSNSAGTISFSGGLPSGYTGSAGTIMNITFRAVGSGAAKVNFSSGSVLANDGKGTNILTGMSGGTYTIQSQVTSPEPEVIVEYVPPANTPGRPSITSTTHPDSSLWYAKTDAVLSWSLPSGVTAVRTLLDSGQYSIPTKVYENPISTITLSDLDQGVNYFHLQFKNADGWGTVAHYRLAVDTERPTTLTISQPEPDFTNPIQTLYVETEDAGSGVVEYLVKIDDAEPMQFETDSATGTITLPSLAPGYHAVVIEAKDAAGNGVIDSYSFTILAFEKPIFTTVPNEVPADVIPVFKGMSRPRSDVTVTMQKIGADAVSYAVSADETGEFIFIPEGVLSTGVYELSATAVDEFGAQSASSDVVRFAVQQPGYLRIGSFVVSVLSILVPLIALIVLLAIMLLFVWGRIRRFRKGVRIESAEAFAMARDEFARVQQVLRAQAAVLAESRKTNKLTKAEETLVTQLDAELKKAESRIEKEIADVQELTDSKNE